VFSSSKPESDSLHDNPDGLDGDPYDKPSYSRIQVYDDIDELGAGYTELQTVKPGKQATSSDDAPEPPPLRSHDYLELINVA